MFYYARSAIARYGNSVADFTFQIYQNESIHVIIAFKHEVTVHCDIRS